LPDQIVHDGADHGLSLGRLAERLARERTTRLAAERIAEDATGRLYRLTEKLERSNAELERLNASQRDLVAIASHELQTPVVPIVGFARTLSDRWDRLSDDQKREFVAVIERQAQRLQRLTNLLLTVSKVNADALEPDLEQVDVGETIGAAVGAFEGECTEIQSSCPHGLVAIADAGMTDQIIANYITNALKYGRPPIEIQGRPAGRFAEIRVIDHGDGVPSPFVDRLFDRFARAEVGGGVGGTGLGLYIARGLARAQQGDAWYAPVGAGGGACFALKLPRSEA